jgi:hypothetical protein
MKSRFPIAFSVCLLATALPPVAQANDSVLGAVVGAGAGALLGQAFGGRDGAIAGGVIGALAGAAQGAHDPVIRVAPPVVYHPYAYQPQVVYTAPGYYAPAYGIHPVYGPAYTYSAPPAVIYRSAPVVVITHGRPHHHHGHGYGHGYGHVRGHWHR